MPTFGCLSMVSHAGSNGRSMPIHGAFSISIPLRERDRFLTLVATDGGDGIIADWTMFGDPRLELSAKADSCRMQRNNEENQRCRRGFCYNPFLRRLVISRELTSVVFCFLFHPFLRRFVINRKLTSVMFVVAAIVVCGRQAAQADTTADSGAATT